MFPLDFFKKTEKIGITMSVRPPADVKKSKKHDAFAYIFAPKTAKYAWKCTYDNLLKRENSNDSKNL